VSESIRNYRKEAKQDKFSLLELKSGRGTNFLYEKSFENIIEFAPIPLLLLTPKGKVVLVNEAMSRLVGYSKEEIIKKNISILNLWPDKKKILRLMEELQKDGKMTDQELLIRNRWGGIRKCLANLKLAEFGGELVIYIVSFDVTEIEEEEDKKKILTQAIESANEGFIIADMDTNITYCNQALVRILGYEKEEVTGKDTGLIHTNQKGDTPDKEDVVEILKKAGKWSGEIMGRKKTGEPIVLHESISYMRDEKGKSYAMMGIVQDITAMRKLEAELLKYRDKYKKLKRQIQKDNEFKQFIGTSPEIQKIKDTIRDVANIDVNILIHGETGTGKELVANLIQKGSARRDKPFIRLNCGALSENLLETELFGHEKGAFTGAIRKKKGKCELANEGTLFLDEIGEILPRMQIALLRFLESGEIQRVGGENTLYQDVRVIAATNKDLGKSIKEGRFRQDLFYRLNVLPICIPPLRERREDIPTLVNHFLHLYRNKYQKKIESISDEVMNLLVNYQWPGNVRELRYLIERLLITNKASRISLNDLRSNFSILGRIDTVAIKAKGRSFKKSVQFFEKDLIKGILKEENNDINRVAKRLGLSRTTVYSKLKSDPDYCLFKTEK